MAGIFVICSDSLRAHSFVIDQVFVFLLPKIIPLGLFFQVSFIFLHFCMKQTLEVLVSSPYTLQKEQELLGP